VILTSRPGTGFLDWWRAGPGQLHRVAIGQYTSFWELRFRWLARCTSTDSPPRKAALVRAQPGDWNFREGIGDTWEYDPLDPHSSSASRITFNSQRRMAALKTHGPSSETSPRSTQFQDFSERARRLRAWLGSWSPHPLPHGQAAIRLDVAALLGNFDVTSKPHEGTTSPAVEATPIPSQDVAARLARSTAPRWRIRRCPGAPIEVSIGFLSVPRRTRPRTTSRWTSCATDPGAEGSGFISNRLNSANVGSVLNPHRQDARLPVSPQIRPAQADPETPKATAGLLAPGASRIINLRWVGGPGAAILRR